MESDESVSGPVNLGNPNEFTIKELAEKVMELVGEGHSCTSKIVYQDLPGDDPTQRQPDISQAKDVLDWQPRVPLDQGLPKTIKYFRDLI